jgi:hypothetical protein
MRRSVVFIGYVLVLAFLSGCATPKDYTAFRQHAPRSVLVLPPLNESLDVKATYGVLSTVTRPLSEMGYYVFPVAVIDQFLKENGLPTAGEMHQIPLSKIHDIIDADAVLYMSVEEYGTKYIILDSSTIVRLNARLVDVETGNLLWDGHVDVRVSASQNFGGGLIGMLVSATVNQVVASSTDQAHGVAAQANTQLLTTSGQGLLYGPYNPNFGIDGQ